MKNYSLAWKMQMYVVEKTPDAMSVLLKFLLAPLAVIDNFWVIIKEVKDKWIKAET